MKLVGQSDKREGWKLYECPFCKKLIHSPYGPELVHCCPPWPKWHRLGDWLDLMLQMLGITKCRYNWARRLIGIKKPCPCPQNQEAANTFGYRFAQRLKNIASKLRNVLKLRS